MDFSCESFHRLACAKSSHPAAVGTTWSPTSRILMLLGRSHSPINAIINIRPTFLSSPWSIYEQVAVPKHNDVRFQAGELPL